MTASELYIGKLYGLLLVAIFFQKFIYFAVILTVIMSSAPFE